ncbi:MAG: Fur family transcriptional regulator [Muribaculaceae bacterium]
MTAREHLEKYGIRPSVQRLAVMQYLMNSKTHPTVEEIYADLVKEIPTLSKTTVYNTLDLLVANRAVTQITIEGGKAHYDGFTHIHSHFYCNECGKIFDMPCDEKHLRTLEPKNGFIIESTQLYYTGICPECRSKNEN